MNEKRRDDRANGGPRPLIFGEVLFDCFSDGSEVLGGAPFNVAWNLQSFGLDPLLVSRVGDDPQGRLIRAAMQDWGMDTGGLQLDSIRPTGQVRVETRGGEPSFDIVAEQAYDYIEPDPLPAGQGFSLIYHGSLALRSQVSRNTLRHLHATTGAPLFVDVNLRAPWWEPNQVQDLLAAARWAKLNQDELLELAPASAAERGSPEALMAAVQNRFDLENLFLTRGAAGASVRNASGEICSVRPEPALRIVDTVGAGDAFASVLILGLAKGWGLESTLQRAQSFASAVVGLRGATSRDPDFYQVYRRAWERG
jgi:fructokinase